MRFETAFLADQDVLIVRVQGTGDAETVPQLLAARACDRLFFV